MQHHKVRACTCILQVDVVRVDVGQARHARVGRVDATVQHDRLAPVMDLIRMWDIISGEP